VRTVEIEIARDAGECFALLADPARIPEWVPGVSSARVVTTDERGRPTRVWFMGAVASAPYSYLLAYDFDDAGRTMRWRIEDATLRDLDGEAQIVETAPGRCRLRYRLHASRLILADGQVQVRDETPEPVVEAFKRWAEQPGVR
jgi:ribosome-associated toxin RatA of RatAB toxin-antitoxin module